MASESFLWLTSLGEVDPVGALPLLGALIALTNAETLGRKREQAMEAVAARKTVSSKSPQSRYSHIPTRKSTVKPQVAEPPANPVRYEPAPMPSRAGQVRRLSTTPPVLESKAYRPIIKTSSRSTARKTLDEIPAEEGPQGKLTDAEKANVRSTFLTYVLRGMAVMFIPFASSAPAVSPYLTALHQAVADK
jgi:hypothetical protein